jgi:hypothetical protein
MTWVEQRFLWHDRIPVGHITVIAGAPAKGKSTLGYRIAADVDVPTIFVTTEETDLTVWGPRVEAAGMDLSKAFHRPEVKFTKRPEDLAYLDELVARYGAKLIIVDPLSNHLRGASIHRDEQVREVFEPYYDWLQSRGVALVLQMHVLKSVNAKHHPLLAVPAGVVSIAKSIFLFGDDPTMGADPNIRVLACPDKFNFGPVPPSMAFEYATNPVSVLNEETGKRRMRDYGYWIFRDESRVSAKALLVTLAPETKERKSDRAAYELLELLREGPQPVSIIRKHFGDMQPPISWRTVERIKAEMGIVEMDDERDKRRNVWRLCDDTLATLDEADSMDEVEIQGVDIDVPDTVPEDWTDTGEGAGENSGSQQ